MDMSHNASYPGCYDLMCHTHGEAQSLNFSQIGEYFHDALFYGKYLYLAVSDNTNFCEKLKRLLKFEILYFI